MNLERFARLITLMHNEGIDLKLIDIGTSLVEKMTVDETIQSENDLADVRMMLSKQSKVAAEDHAELKSKVRVYIDGCFDLMHAGHFNSFRQAKKLGDVLVLGINSDEEVEAVKGPTVFNGRER